MNQTDQEMFHLACLIREQHDLEGFKKKKGKRRRYLDAALLGWGRSLQAALVFLLLFRLGRVDDGGSVWGGGGEVWQNFPLSNRPVCFYNQSHAHTHCRSRSLTCTGKIKTPQQTAGEGGTH